MARIRVTRFDDPRYFDLEKSRAVNENIIPKTDPRRPAIVRRLIWTFAKSIVGYIAMGGLVALAFYGFGATYQLGVWGGFWSLLPVALWLGCHKLAIKMTKSTPADPSNPRHQHVINLIKEVHAESGMKHLPKIYASPNPMPNAFATGPFHRWAVVAFTEGLLNMGATDAEIKAIFAHELGHVRNYDVAINSFLGVLSSLFFLIAQSGLWAIVGAFSVLNRFTGIARFIPKIVTNVLFFGVFWFTSQVTKIIQMFVVRSRESGADATGAYITGDPCSLATALEKLVDYITKNRPKPGERDEAMFRALRPIMIVDPIYDTLVEVPAAVGVGSRLKAVWRNLMLTHPPVPDRIKHLERMNGGSCKRG